jgi:prolyl oligopeptidase
MKHSIWIVAVSFAVVAAVAARGADGVSDPYVWLEDVHGTKPLAWVAEQNTRTKGVLQADPRYAADHDAILKVLDATDRIPLGAIDHDYIFNFWQDAANPKGVWRRSTIADYARPDPKWETIIDVDKLAADERENWIWKGASCSNTLARCLVFLSRDGGDAHVVREFDLKTRSFLKDGFTLAHAKSGARYLGENAVLFETDFGPDTMTASGYPRIVKLWRRGTPVDTAKTIYEGKREDVATQGSVSNGPYGTYALIVRATSFFESEYFHVLDDGSVRKLPLPLSAVFQGVSGEHMRKAHCSLSISRASMDLCRDCISKRFMSRDRAVRLTPSRPGAMRFTPRSMTTSPAAFTPFASKTRDGTTQSSRSRQTVRRASFPPMIGAPRPSSPSRAT